MTKQEFIKQIAAAAQKYGPNYGIKVVSPVVAQACLESAYGTSNKAQYHNYFGLKYRKGRVTCNSGYFQDGSSEQKDDGTYIPITDDWYSFATLEDGVEGYYQFINISRYNNLKGVTDPKTYLENIKADGYATSNSYVNDVYKVITEWNLTQYDKEGSGGTTVGYTNSSLVTCTVKSPNHSGTRTHNIDRITPHCVVGQLAAANIGGCFTSSSRQASSNYGIGTEGGICLIVDECNRSWCSSSNANDQRAITIECASDKTAPYAFNDTVYNKLIELCVDICKRYNKTKVVWISDKNTALAYEPKANEILFTVHRWFADTACPGEWLMGKMEDLANQVNSKLGGGGGSSTTGTGTTSTQMYRVRKTWADVASQKGAYRDLSNAKAKCDENPGYSVFDNNGNVVYTSTVVTVSSTQMYRVRKTWTDASTQKGAYRDLNNAKECCDKNAGYSVFDNDGNIVYSNSTSTTTTSNTLNEGDVIQLKSGATYATGGDIPKWVFNSTLYYRGRNNNGIIFSTQKTGAITGVVKEDMVTKVSSSSSSCPYIVRVTVAALNIRKGPGTNYSTNGCIKDKGSYTIVEETNGWGRLKSGVGWICLDYVKKV